MNAKLYDDLLVCRPRYSAYQLWEQRIQGIKYRVTYQPSLAHLTNEKDLSILLAILSLKQEVSEKLPQG